MGEALDNLKSLTLKELDAYLIEMTSPQRQIELLDEPPEISTRVRQQMLAAQQARLRLANAQLNEIHDSLETEEDALLAGCRNLEATLKHGERTQKVLAAVDGLLGVVGRIVPLA